MFAGLFALNPQNLRGLILADRSPALAVGLLLFGLIITFGSMAMGSGIMMISHHDKSGCGSLPIRAPTDVTCEPLASKSEMSNRSLHTEESVLPHRWSFPGQRISFVNLMLQAARSNRVAGPNTPHAYLGVRHEPTLFNYRHMSLDSRASPRSGEGQGQRRGYRLRPRFALLGRNAGGPPGRRAISSESARSPPSRCNFPLRESQASRRFA